jgi:hypothetical protein
VLLNIANYKALPAGRDLTNEKVQALKDTQNSIQADKTQKSEIASYRKIMIQGNIGN